MADKISKERRSKNMSKIRGKETSLEVKVRKELFRRGFRYRKNVKDLPGRPDIVLPKYKTVIFVNGCFWHRHGNCRLTTTPKSNTEFWETKFKKNIENDIKKQALLRQDGWKVIVVWECDIKKDFEKVIDDLEKEILMNIPNFEEE